MWQGEDGVESSQLGHAPIERVRWVAEDHRVAERLDHVSHAEADRAEEKGEQPRRSVRDEVIHECPDRRHQRESRCHPGQVEDDDQGQVKKGGEVAERDPEQEEVGGWARLRGVPVVPRPCALPALPHLGEVCVGVVPQVKEAHEHLVVRLDRVGVQVRNTRDDREYEAGQERHAPLSEGKARTVAGPIYLLCVHRLKLKRKTVNNALRTSPCETFEAPATRSSKRIGVSTTWYPSRRARYTISI